MLPPAYQPEPAQTVAQQKIGDTPSAQTYGHTGAEIDVPKPNMDVFPFLDLPPELRNRIYSILGVDNRWIEGYYTEREIADFSLSLIPQICYCNKQIWRETRLMSMAYVNIDVDLFTSYFPSNILAWLEAAHRMDSILSLNYFRVYVEIDLKCLHFQYTGINGFQRSMKYGADEPERLLNDFNTISREGSKILTDRGPDGTRWLSGHCRASDMAKLLRIIYRDDAFRRTASEECYGVESKSFSRLRSLMADQRPEALKKSRDARLEKYRLREWKMLHPSQILSAE